MIIYHKCSTFQVLDSAIHLYSEELQHGYSTIAEIGDKLFHLGNEVANISTAIFAWEYVNNRLLTQEELRQVLTENKVL